jgi:hypothetical protein
LIIFIECFLLPWTLQQRAPAEFDTSSKLASPCWFQETERAFHPDVQIGQSHLGTVPASERLPGPQRHRLEVGQRRRSLDARAYCNLSAFDAGL